MTHVISAKNVNDALASGLWWLHVSGQESGSRNGKVLVSPEPVITEYHNPMERVLFNKVRDANPFFHLFESLWMLAGENDVKFVTHYAQNMKTFSDDGDTLHGAYGFRWRTAMGVDQLSIIINELKHNPESRRCVLQMWDASVQTDGMRDLTLACAHGKDVPCNTQAYFDTLGGELNMTVTCRSNDVIWGCYGANAVHFSMLHEYVARCVDMNVGVYRQFSNNYHMYLGRPDVDRLWNRANGAPSIQVDDRYTEMAPMPIMQRGERAEWDADNAHLFLRWTPTRTWEQHEFETEWFRTVVQPLLIAHQLYKEDNLGAAMLLAQTCAAEDWRTACVEWLERRAINRAAKVAA